MAGTRFLFVASDFKPSPGGRAEYVDNLARGLIALGIETKVLAVARSDRKEQIAFLERYEPWTIPFPVYYDARPKHWAGNGAVSAMEVLRCVSPTAGWLLEKTPLFRGSTESVARFDRILDRIDPKWVIFGHLDMRLYALALHLFRRGLSYGILVHGREVPRDITRKNDFVKRGTFLNRAAWIIANSRATKALIDVWRIPEQKISIVHPPMAREALTYSAANRHSEKVAFRLVTLCRLVKGKAIDVVLRSVKRLAEKGIPCKYVIGGDGSERQALERLVHELELQDVVRFLGHITGEDKWRALCNSDVFVMPSREEPSWVESFGIGFIEAAAFGLPSIGSRTGGIADAILDGETGLLVSPDSPEELAEALSFIYRNPDKAREMGRIGRERAKTRFSPTAIAEIFQRSAAKVFENKEEKRCPAWRLSTPSIR